MTVSNEDLISAVNIEAIKRLSSVRFSQKHHIVIKKDRRFFICILLVSTVLLSAIIFGFYYYASGPPETCHSPECFRSAAAFMQNMDLSVDPCEDFYSYTCGNWAKNHPIPEGRNFYTWFEERQLKIFRNILAKLETNTSRSDPKPVNQARDLYKSCMDVDQRNRIGLTVDEEYFAELGLPTLPTLMDHNRATPKHKFDWIATVAKVQRKLGFNILIGFDVIEDHVDRNRNRLVLEYHYSPQHLITGEIDFPPYEWSKLKTKSHKRPLVEAVEDYYEIEEDGGRDENDNFDAKEKYMDFVKNLPNLRKENAKKDDPSLYTIEELQNITDSYIGKHYPVWQHYIDELFADLPDAKPTTVDKLQISSQNLDYLKELVRLVSKEPQEIMELYIWTNVTKFIKNHKYNRIKTDKECAENVQTLMGLAVSYAIAEKDFLEHTKPRIERMLENIRFEFNEIVQETDWMDEVTRNATLEKAQAMQSLIGFPEWILDVEKLEQHYEGLHIERDQYLDNWLNAIEFLQKNKLRTWRLKNDRYWDLDPTKVNAFYLQERNAINIPVAVVQYPFYYLGLEALNYGALGETIGHELTHGFDDSGRDYDKFGIKTRWWSNSTLQEYDKRANCLVDQYSSYYVKEANGYINGTLTLGENIADNGGLREAFRAYRAYVKRKGPELLLPGFKDFSHEQLFFISYGNQYCGSISPLAGEMLDDEHSPDEFRVKGALSNLEEFAEVFKCAPGSKMNPARKCRVW